MTVRSADQLPRDPRASFSPERTEVLEGAEPAASASEDGSSPPGTRAGYALVTEIGRGGMGEIWEARQTSLLRPIALKRLRQDLQSGLSPAQVASLRRMFQEEALTTASLEHPNIVPVHDLFFDERGFPMLAMKLVKGKPWDAVIHDDYAVLSPAELLAKHLPILIDVGQAVAFAHSKGVIHRDLKPSQVMVGEFGEVLLMDWGLAISVVERGSSERTPFAPHRSEASSPAGTFAFMAPEQTEETAERVGPWTDVYLLGGTLYYLLTGCLPHPGKTTAEAFAEARLAEVAPPERRAKDRDVPPELSALCRRAMAKAPEDRLPGARAFVDGLSDYLSGAGKRREARELVAEVVARRAQERGESASYRVLTECESTLARAQGLWPEHPEASTLRERVLHDYARAALAHGDLILAQVQAERLSDGSSRDGVLATIASRREALARSARQHRALRVVSAVFLALLVLGALGYTLQQAAARRELVASRDRANAARSDAENLVGFMLGDLRDKLRPVGRLDVMDDVSKRALAYLDALPEADQSDETQARRARTLRQIGEVRYDRGDLDGALATLTASLGMTRQLLVRLPGRADLERDEAEALRSVGNVGRSRGELPEALARYREAEAIFSRLVAQEPTNVPLLRLQFQARNHVAMILRMQGKTDEALAVLSGSSASVGRLVALEPDNPRWRHARAESVTQVAWVKELAGALPEARAGYRESVGIMRTLHESDQTNSLFSSYLAQGLLHVSSVAGSLGDLEEATSANREAEELLRGLTSRDPGNAVWQRDLASALVDAAVLRCGDGPCRDGDEAERRLEEATKILRGLLARSPDDRQTARRLGEARLASARVAAVTGESGTEVAALREAAEILASAAAGAGTAEDAAFLAPLAEALARLDRREEAKPVVAKLLGMGLRDHRLLDLFRSKGLLP